MKHRVNDSRQFITFYVSYVCVVSKVDELFTFSLVSFSLVLSTSHLHRSDRDPVCSCD